MIKTVRLGWSVPKVIMNLRGIKIGSHLLMLTLILLALSACGRHEANSSDPLSASAIEQKARRYLQPFFRVGESVTNVIADFGEPSDQYRTGSGELSMDFDFADDNSQAHAAGVGGFTAFFRDNKLLHWEPIYRSAASDFTNQKIIENNFMFNSDHTVIAFDLVSEVQRPQMTYVNTTRFPSLGYIPEVPDVAVRSGHYTTYDEPASSLRTIRITLSQADADSLNAITSKNIGKKLAVLANSQVVMVANLHFPLSGGDLIVRLPDPAYSTLLSALQKSAVSKK
jgi:hypothetical protein